MTTVLAQVKENLLFYNLWTQVAEINLSNDVLLEGIPKEPLLNDEVEEAASTTESSHLEENDAHSETLKREVVLPFRLNDKLTPKRLKSIFDELEKTRENRPKRIVIGIVNDDSTVVYYFIHDGIYKPKRN